MIDFKDGYGKRTSEYDKAKQFKGNDFMRHTNQLFKHTEHKLRWKNVTQFAILYIMQLHSDMFMCV